MGLWAKFNRHIHVLLIPKFARPQHTLKGHSALGSNDHPINIQIQVWLFTVLPFYKVVRIRIWYDKTKCSCQNTLRLSTTGRTVAGRPVIVISGRNWWVLCLEHCFIWFRDLKTKKHWSVSIWGALKWCWRRMGKIKWAEKVTNEEVLERIGEKRAFQNNILRRKANWIGHIEKKLPLYDAIEGQMTDVKGVGRRRRRTQLIDDLRNRRRYWELKEEAEDRKS